MRLTTVGVALAGSFTSASVATARAQAMLPPPLELRVPKAPTVATGAEGAFLAYELHVTNFGAQPLTLRTVEVITADRTRRVLFTLSDSTLAQSLARPGVTLAAAERPRIAGGMRGVVYLWMPVDTSAVPTSFRHRVRVEQGAGDSLRVQELEGPVVPVRHAGPVIGPPLRGGPWLSGNGPNARSGHRRALVSTGGTPAIAQRFAIDFVKLNDSNTTFHDDRLRNENYYAEGDDALAVADGRVVAMKDSIPENVPGVNSRAVPITLETVGGNHVILDIGGGYYAFYAHLRPGSLRVRVGDRVRRGQVVGLVGNSGNSTEPHLHFHVSDADSPLGSEGV
ncbi:MAG TPA: M23 family metallopeptidase, partial [Gemmatimonadaceae bacterium]|nr:M23 family metallopeptidase [Gemmatimonadaceae bacterium]